jgi:hypothetical protein
MVPFARAFGFARATRFFAFGRARFLAPAAFAFGARERGGALRVAAGLGGAAGVVSSGNISGGIGEGISISSSMGRRVRLGGLTLVSTAHAVNKHGGLRAPPKPPDERAAGEAAVALEWPVTRA